MVAIKRKYQNLEAESRDLHDLVHMLMDRPRQEAIFILDHMRRTHDASSTLAFIKDGDLLVWGRSVPHPSDSTTVDHDPVREITQRVDLMNGRDNPRSASQDGSESIEPPNSPKRRLAISDLVNNT
ncbi:unnamed protein product [Aureobasidium vineae]|uniref:Uncharacterized protein n=1 Tax=Aureobasidium vineae TaxID=2773715 RepID=A0A9N8J974_9PEZI|nr:unnamed protein product [Aureobasidium vineae]